MNVARDEIDYSLLVRRRLFTHSKIIFIIALEWRIYIYKFSVIFYIFERFLFTYLGIILYIFSIDFNQLRMKPFSKRNAIYQ